MKSIIKYIYQFQWISLLILLAFVSCQTDSGLPGSEKPGTLFSPYISTSSGTLAASAVSDSLGLTVSLGWLYTTGARYQIEYSRDNFSTVERILTSDTNYVKMPGVWGSKLQYLRVKTVSKDPHYKDSKYTTMSFTTNSEQIFSATSYTPSADSVSLKWDSTRLVSNLKASVTGLTDSIIFLTNLERFHGRTTVRNLLNKAYTLKLLGKYSDLQVRGTSTATFNFKTITFNTQVADVSVKSIKVSTGKKATKPTNPLPGLSQPTGTLFVDWYKEPACINVFNFTTSTITSDITLYAKWQ